MRNYKFYSPKYAFWRRLLLSLVICGTYSAHAGDTRSEIPIGKYIGYCDQFAIVGTQFILEGDTGFGEGCEFEVTKDGVKLGGEFFSGMRQAFRLPKRLVIDI